MMLTIIGLGITTIISLIGIVTTDGRQWLKSALAGLTLVGFSRAAWSAWTDHRDKEDATKDTQRAQQALTNANDQLAALRNAIALVKFTVRDRAKLNELSGGAQYYVRIAADTSRDRLEPYLRAINTEFKGAQSSGMASIRAPRSGSRNYELVFGQGLDVAAAEVFHRLAISHHLTPAAASGQEVASIVPEPALQ
jgi:hypothetical protein